MIIASIVVYFVYGRKGSNNYARQTKRMTKHVEKMKKMQASEQ
jgi:hypothetical protein